VEDYQIHITLVFVGFACLEILMGRFLNWHLTSSKDLIIEIVSGLSIPLLIVPSVLVLTATVLETLDPTLNNSLGHWSAAAMFFMLLVVDDLTQYWWHRAAHRFPRLYGFHRAHHSASYMSVRVVYRNSLIYYALMPGLWLSSILVHLGFGPVYIWYAIAKMTIIIAAHSSVLWDAPLLENRLTARPMWLIRRVISTPITHHAHHGRYQEDENTHYKGNYGNFLFLWDVIFGTAKIKGGRPSKYGLENVDEAGWFAELVWPFSQTVKQYEQDNESLSHGKEVSP